MKHAKTKRILSLLLTLLMVVSMFPTSAFAVEVEQTEETEQPSAVATDNDTSSEEKVVEESITEESVSEETQSGEQVLLGSNNVAKIGDTEYATLQEAINAATDNTETEIDLIADISYDTFAADGGIDAAIVVPAKKKIKLDLYGHTISGTSSANAAAYLIHNKGYLTVIDSGTNGKITYKSIGPDSNYGYGTSTILNRGVLTVASGTIENTTTGGASYAVDNQTLWFDDMNPVNFYLTGGVVVCTAGDAAIRQSAGCGTVYLKDGEIVKNNIEIGGGTVTGDIWIQNLNASYTGIKISGGTITGSVYTTCSDYTNMTASITGGNIGRIGRSSETTAFMEGIVTGGSFANQPRAGFIASGYEVTTSAGSYPYVVSAAKTYVAQIGENKYETLAAAVAAAEDGDTIELLCDIALTETINVNKTITIDGTNGENNFTITDTADAEGHSSTFYFKATGKTFTIQNCIIKNDGKDSMYGAVEVTGTNSKLIVNNCTFTPGTKSYYNLITHSATYNGDSVAVEFTNNTVDVTAGSFMPYLREGSKIIGNTFSNIGEARVTSIMTNSGSTDAIEISGNTFVGCTKEGIVKVYAQTESGSTSNVNLILKNNTCTNCTGAVLNVESDTVLSVDSNIANTAGKAIIVAKGQLTITGGTYAGKDKAYEKSNGTLAISGGTFNNDPTADVPDKGYEIKENTPEKGLWTVSENKIVVVDPEGEKTATVETDQTTSLNEEKATEVYGSEAEAEKAEQNTEVTGVELTTKVDEEAKAKGETSGLQQVVDAAKEKVNNDTTKTEEQKKETLEALEKADTINVNVDVIVEPISKTTGKIVVKLTPKATVSVGDTTIAEDITVTNDMIDQTKPISVTVYVGFKPQQLVHRADDGSIIEYFNEGNFIYDDTEKTATVTVSHFSTVEGLATPLVSTNFYEDDNGVWHVANEDGLSEFKAAVNGGNDFSGKTVVLDKSLDMSGVTWTEGIGIEGKVFKGTFEGQNNIISNVTINGTAKYVGLFGAVFGATIKNLTLSNPSITNTATDYTGALVGGGYAKVDSCTVSGGSVTGVDQVGGVIGYLSCGFVKNCTVNGTNVSGSCRVGGIAGKANVDSEYEVSYNTVKSLTVTTSKTVEPDIASASALVGQIMTGETSKWLITDNNIDTVTTMNGTDSTFVPIGVFRSGNYRADTVTAGHVVRNHWTPATETDSYNMVNPSNKDEFVTINNFYAVAEIVGGLRYASINEALAAVNEQTGDDVTLNILSDITEELTQSYTFAKNLTITAASAVKVDLDCIADDKGYNNTYQLIPDDGTTLKIGENVSLLNIYNIGADRTSGTLVVNGNVTAAYIRAYGPADSEAKASLVINGTVSGAGESCMRLANNCSVTINGTIAVGTDVTSVTPQVTGLYFANTASNCDFTVNDASVNMAQGFDAKNTKFTLVNSYLHFSDMTSGNSISAELDATSVFAIDDTTLASGKTITAKVGSVLRFKTLTNNGTITVDMTGATADSYTIIDITGTAKTAVADFGTVNLTNGKDYKLVVKDGDLIAQKKDPVASVTIGNTTTNYTDLHEALEAGTASGSVVTLLSNVDLTGVEWTPIDTFQGTLDGAGHTISNLTVLCETKAGLFANLSSGGLVKDLTITKANITATNNYAGAVAGYGFQSNVTGVTVTNSTITSTEGQYVGGIVGGTYTDITNCTVTGNNISGSEQVGGVIGYACGSEINGCTVNNTVSGSSRVGGVVGKFQSGDSSMTGINSNIVSGSVTATDDLDGGLAGQIMGANTGYELKNNTINVTGTTNPIATLRASQNAAFTGALAANITGNWWEDATLAEDSFHYTNVASGVDAQTIYRGVAKIGDKCYKTLADAIAAANTAGSGTITMIADTSFTFATASYATVNAGSNIVIDINGKKVVSGSTYSTASQLIENKGTLTIKDSVENSEGYLKYGANPVWIYDGSGSYTGSYASNLITNNGTVTVESGYLENLATDSYASYVVDNNSNGCDAVLNVKGGTLKGRVAIRQFANSATNVNTVTITAGTVEGTRNAVLTQNPSSNASFPATLNISGGTLLCTTNGKGIIQYWDCAYGTTQTTNLSVNVTGGYFNGDTIIELDPSTISEEDLQKGINFSAGYFTSKLGSNYLAAGYEIVANTDESTKTAYPWTVQEAPRTINVSTTEDLQNALDAAKKGDTIVVAAGTYDTVYLRNNGTDANRIMKDVTVKAADEAIVDIVQIAYQSQANKSLDIENLTIDGLVFSDASHTGINLDVNGGYLRVNGLTVQNCSKTGNGVKSGTTYDEGYFIGLQYDGGTDIGTKFVGDESLTAGYHDIKILNNALANIYQPIAAPNAGPLYGLTVSGNTFTGCVQNHMMLSSKTTGTVTITNNTIDKMEGRFLRASGAQTDASFVITDNTVTNPSFFEDEYGTDVVKITGTAGFTVTDEKNTWNTGSFEAQDTWISRGTPVAMIGTKNFGTLQAAFDAAANGETIKVVADITLNNPVTVSKGADVAITLDLNGKTISKTDDLTDACCMFDVNSDLTVTDSSEGAAGKVIYTKTVSTTIWVNENVFNVNDGDLVIEKGNYEFIATTPNSCLASYVVNISNNWCRYCGHASATINGGTFSSTNGDAVIRVHDQNDSSDKITLTVNDGTFTGGAGDAVVWLDVQGNNGGVNPSVVNVNLKGGTYTAAAGQQVLDFGSGTGSDASGINVEISGGKYFSNADQLMRVRSISDANLSKIVVSGGYFNKTGVYRTTSATDKNLSDFVKAGKTLTETPEGDIKTAGYIYTVEDAPVAQIGDKTYTTLADAIAAVPTDGTQTTITMIADETIDGNAGVTVAGTQKIILDLNGHTIKNAVNEDKGSQVITNKGTLTIKDSTDTNEDGTGSGLLTNAIADGTNPGEWWSTPQYNYVTNVITNTGTLTIESGKLLQTASGHICYAVDNQSGNGNAILNVSGGLLKSTKCAVRMCCKSTTQDNILNMTGGTIEAENSGLWVQLPGSSSSDAVKGTLNISGGTLHGGSYAFYDYSYGNIYDNVKYNLSGGTYNGTCSFFSYGANIDITGGTYNGTIAIKQAVKASNVSISGGKFAGEVYTYSTYASEHFISGGVYSVEPDAAYLATGYSVINNSDSGTKIAYPYAVGTRTEGIVIRVISDNGTSTEVKVDVDTTVDYDVDVDVSKDLKIPEDVLKEIENKTVVQGLELQPAATTALDNINGVQAVVDAAKEQAKKEYNNAFTNAVAASTNVDTVVTVDVDVIVTPIAYDANNKTVKFDLTPYATVSIRNANDATATQTVEVTNEMINTAKDITVQLYTVTEPMYLLHKTDDGGLIDTYYRDTDGNKPEGSKTFSFDSATGVCTAVINHFSTMEPVNTGDAPTVVAKIGELGYSTLQAAVDVVKTGETITITAANTEALTVSEAKTFTISGGTFVTPTATSAFEVTVITATGLVTVTEKTHEVQLTSRIAGTDTTVVSVSGGGDAIGEATGTTVYAANKDGYKFKGWYVKYATQEGTPGWAGTLVSEDNVFTYKPQDDHHVTTAEEVKEQYIVLYAVYEADSSATVQLIVNASNFSLQFGSDDATVQDTEYQDTVEAGTLVTLKYTGNDKFLYWRNSSKAIISTNKELSTVLVSDSEFTAVTADNQTTGRALVVFMNAEENGQQLKANYYTDTSNISYPSNPNKYGKTFERWALKDGSEVEATVDKIHALITGGATYIIVYADYSAKATYTVTTQYKLGKDGKATSLGTVKVESGDTCYREYDWGTDYELDYWMVSYGNVADKIVSTTEYYEFIPVANTTLTAVLAEKGQRTEEPINRVTIEDVTASKINEKYTLTLRASYTIHSNISKVGFLYWTNDTTEFTYENKEYLKYYEWDKTYGGNDSGEMVLNVTAKSADSVVYYRAFAVLTDGTTVYYSASHDEYSKSYTDAKCYNDLIAVK